MAIRSRENSEFLVVPQNFRHDCNAITEYPSKQDIFLMMRRHSLFIGLKAIPLQKTNR